MTFLDWLERRFARLAFPGLINYVVGLNALVYLLVLTQPQYAAWLTLEPALILQGQVWRLVSWIFLPVTTSLFFTFMYLWATWSFGNMLEAAWGTFRLNIFYLLGIILCIFSAMIFGTLGGSFSLNLTVLLAVATLAPDMEILFYFLPLKIKWLALISIIAPIYVLLFAPLPLKAMVIVSLGNYLIFFTPTLIRNLREKRGVQVRRARFEAAQDPTPFLHQCHTCGITEISHPLADFRVAADENEYCLQHLPARTPSRESA